MRYTEISDLDKDKIIQKIADAQKELVDMKFKLVANQLKDVSSIRKLKKDLARFKTRLTLIEKEKNNG